MRLISTLGGALAAPRSSQHSSQLWLGKLFVDERCVVCLSVEKANTVDIAEITWEAPMIEPFIAVIVGIVIAGTSSWITVKLSLKQFRTERWWERKADAYSAIIEALHDAKSFADLHLDAEYAGKEIDDEKGAEVRARSLNAQNQILKTMDVGAFIVSERAIGKLKNLRKGIEGYL
ncbi:MAG: hypothetical protein U5K76_02805 [Woeseiaceae bacterium]|nr:hypothetical protein [Woeseiaceae bacterium]